LSAAAEKPDQYNHPFYHKKAIEGIVYASKLATEGRTEEAQKHLDSAKTFVMANVEHLRSKGEGKAADEYAIAANTHIERVVEAMKKPKTFTKATPQLKGPAAEERAQYNSTGKRGDLKTKTPGRDSRYKYVPIHGLSPMDQTLAHSKFGGKDMHHYEYPVGDNGALVHANRSPLTHSPRPSPESYKTLKPDYMPGAAVDIHPSSGMPQRFGIVRAPSPYHPGKIMVQHGPMQHQTVAVDPIHLAPRPAQTRMEKALQATLNLKKQLGG
jgi:hypothetical protein